MSVKHQKIPRSEGNLQWKIIGINTEQGRKEGRIFSGRKQKHIINADGIYVTDSNLHYG